MRRRFAISGVIAAVTAIALSAAGLAAGGFGGPGTFTFKDTFAIAGLTDSTGAFMFINVDFGMQTFKFRGVNGPPIVMGPETVLNYNVMSADGTTTAIGCFVIPDSSFKVATDLSSATLTVDPSIETACPGVPIPPGSGGRPGLAGIVPDAGSGGSGGGTPITANLVWTSNGAVTVTNNTSNSRCQNVVANSNGSSTSTFDSVSGSTSALLDVFSQFAMLQRFSTRETISGTFSRACIGL
jgi:hypothetical protein